MAIKKEKKEEKKTVKTTKKVETSKSKKEKEVKKTTAKPKENPKSKASSAGKEEWKTATVKGRNYHVVKRPEDGKWAIKISGGSKVIKLFDTKVEAMEYAEQLGENQGRGVLSHASKGKNKGKIQ